MHYLDHNATSTLRPEARTALVQALAISGNASSIHGRGRAARAAIERARESIAARLEAPAQNLVFTSGATEANFLALTGAILGAAEAEARITRLFVSAIEHPSVLENARQMGERTAGLRLEILPVESNGALDLGAARAALREGKGRALVALMAANNETGVLQPVAEVSRLAKEVGALLLVDAVHTAGSRAGFEETGADYLSVSSHKLGGPQGVGALIVREGAPFGCAIRGGGQESGRRAGTENVTAIAGFAAAADSALGGSDLSRVRSLRDRFETALRQLAPEAAIFGETVPRLANTSNFAIPGLAAETALVALDLDGVMVSSGAACSSGKVELSHVLRAMGVAPGLAAGALRVSFGWDSQEIDVDAAIESLARLLARVRARAA